MAEDNKDLKEEIIKVLKTIPDSELGISIWDLGLIYKITTSGKKAEILMTLTTTGCPLFSQIADSVKTEVEKLSDIESVFIDLTFEPIWTSEKMTKDARVQLGL